LLLKKFEEAFFSFNEFIDNFDITPFEPSVMSNKSDIDDIDNAVKDMYIKWEKESKK